MALKNEMKAKIISSLKSDVHFKDAVFLCCPRISTLKKELKVCLENGELADANKAARNLRDELRILSRWLCKKGIADVEFITRTGVGSLMSETSVEEFLFDVSGFVVQIKKEGFGL